MWAAFSIDFNFIGARRVDEEISWWARRNLLSSSVMMRFAQAVMTLLVLLALYLLGRGLLNVRRAYASAHWPTTVGVVVSAESSTSQTQDQGRRTTFYAANILIRYPAQGKVYTTDLIHFGQTFGSADPSEAAMQLLRYPVGSPVSVSYDPTAPAMGVVKPGIHADAFWLVGAGLAFLLPAIMCLVVLPGLFAQGVGGHGSPFAIATGVFGAIFCALGILALSVGLQRLWNGHASETWPTAPGEVVSATLTENVVEIGTAPSEPTDSVGFVYRYEVNGTTHYNNLRRFGADAGPDGAEAARTAARYPVGAKVKVAYNPIDPDLASVETGFDEEALALPGFGAGGFLFGLLVLTVMAPMVRSAF